MRAQIYIPSRGRAGACNAPNIIPADWRSRTTIVCTPGEGDAYREAYPEFSVVEAPEGTRNIGMKREWIIHSLAPAGPIIMLDDDVRIFVRAPGNPKKLVLANVPEVAEMLSALSEALGTYAMAGVVNRFMGHTKTESLVPANIRQVLGVNVKVMRERDIHITVSNQEDVQLVMSCVTRGLPTIALHEWAVEGGPYNGAGGCNLFRSNAVIREAVQALCDQFPGYVKMRESKMPGIGDTVCPRVFVVRAFKDAQKRGLK